MTEPFVPKLYSLIQKKFGENVGNKSQAKISD